MIFFKEKCEISPQAKPRKIIPIHNGKRKRNRVEQKRQVRSWGGSIDEGSIKECIRNTKKICKSQEEAFLYLSIKG
ncbi:uncharacterized protein VTP21DRAFT_2196 [Calcarisporiella thermophila]|uniref:uncharacterized protein n=1 Tax=Calcarisporiella thermophila TaxID=911321 RepID=UPI003742C209